MIFLAVMPLSAAFFNFLIPLQIGARDVAFPRLNAFSYWMFLFGRPVPERQLPRRAPLRTRGWFGYANLTSSQYSPGHNIDFWVLGLQMLGIASIAAGINFIVTIINMRAPGMRLMRMPVFTWMSLVTQFLIVPAFPVITVALVFLMFDRFFGTNFYQVAAGGDLAALAAPLLAVRTPRGVHPDPAGDGHHLRGASRRSRGSRCSGTRSWCTRAC